MISTGAGYKTKLESQANQPRIRFLFYKDSLTDTSIAFNENTPAADTITDSNSGFVAAGFEANDMIMVSGSTSNNGSYTIASIAAGTITLIAGDDLADEAAGDTVTIIASRTSYDPYFESVSTLRSDTRLSVGTAIVKLINTAQTWNIFESDDTNIGKTAQLKLFFVGDSEYITYFTGTVERVLYEGTLTILYLRDKMAQVLDLPLGDGQLPVPLYNSPTSYNPADMVWTILTTYGGLDTTVSVQNVDIDYTPWNAWKTDCTSKNYAIRARFTGHSIRQALLSIANRVNAHIFINHEGKFDFGPPYHSSTQTFSGADCLKIDMEISKEDLVNKYNVYYGYQHEPGDRIWTTPAHTLEDATSIADFGEKEFTEESTIVWHWNYDSAVSGATYKLNDYDRPVKWIIMEATMKGFITEIGDEITVTESLKGLSSETVRILEIVSLNLTKGTTILKGMMTT